MTIATDLRTCSRRRTAARSALPCLAALLLLLLPLSGCAAGSKDLTGSWSLDEFVEMPFAPGVPPPGETRPRVTFESMEAEGEARDGRVSGFGGVNRFFGRYRIGAGGTIAVASLGSTKMAGPPELMALERIFLGVIQSAQRYSIEKDILTLEGEPGRIRLSRVAEKPKP